jgi:hypothetical protein
MRVRKVKQFVIVLLFLSFAGMSGQKPYAFADYYMYTNSKGILCISNQRNNVPPKYRATMKIIREETLAKKDPGAPKQAQSEPSSLLRDESSPADTVQQAVAPQATSRIGQLTARFPWLKLLAIIAGIAASFIIVRKIAAAVPSPQLARLILLVFFLSVMVFFYKSYTDYLVNSYFSIKTKFLGMLNKANTREAPESGEKSPASMDQKDNP